MRLYLGDSITNLTDLSGADYGVTLVRGEKSIIPEIRRDGQSIAQGQGVILAGGDLGPRTWPLNLVIVANSQPELRTKYDNLVYLISTFSKSDGYMQMSDGGDRVWKGRVKGDLSGVDIGTGSAELPLKFECSKAMAYGIDEETQTLTVATDPDSFTVPAADTIEGTGYATPVWVIKNTSGAQSDCTITNSTTEQAIDVLSIPNNGWVRLDVEEKTIELSTDSGSTYADAYNLLGTNRNFPEFAPRAANTITTSELGTGSIVATWRARYI